MTAVCVLHELREGYFHETAIDKRPVAGAVEVGRLGLAGDRQIDSSHGGRDGAVYVYADEDADHFADVLGREVEPGLFGENVRVRGVDVTGAAIGEVWQFGEVRLEVRKPRTPCQNLALRVGVDRFHVDFARTGRVGALCRVLTEGRLAAGDPVEVVQRPDHGVTIGSVSRGLTPQDAQVLLDSGVPLATTLRGKATRAAARQQHS